ncbi:ABC transporter ATP-binding protein [Micromonospora sp. C28SCA-DRY-2]|uniref:ABC transporter ATP-binding protein n=1 Tax=Micromonospora sp. C28SCA-DRY-2 TaxID=3059522 RepID=UPI002676B9B6|nr:ABC transporter ATP-binding protein [Micromonospora sp. C28SCA-DRY-2]MDO3703198.1 ABC transporter ATP-binding protein [Micromonospora sp. C28SCA-DRY-2]
MSAGGGPAGRGAGIRVTGLVKRFRSGDATIVGADRISLAVPAGATVAVTGPSGSGKSTLLHLIGAIERADEGRIDVDDVEVTGLSGRRLARYRRGVGFVFQRFHLLPALSAVDNVLAPLLPYRTSFDKVERARSLLAEVGLAGRERAQPAQLSGGQQQRVAIARALVGRPRLLLADEPTGNLDSATGEEIINLLWRLRDEHGMTLLMATHEAALADRCDRTVRIHDGRIV